MPLEVGRVAPWVPTAVFRQEDPVGVVCPTRACFPDVVRTEALWQAALPTRLSNVVYEPAHAVDGTH